ncbi:MAG: phosphatase PAP2 family protein [Coriobacteriales bacterium]|jgi:membrane-associated phospholipid phosphatase
MNDTFVSISGQGSYHQQQSKPLRGVSGRALIPAIIAGLLFVGIMFSVVRDAGWVSSYDNTIEGAIMAARTDALSPIFRTLSFIGSSKVMAAIAVIFLIFLLVKKQFKAAIYFVVVLVVTVVVCLAVKYGVGRPRPLDFLLDAELVEKEPCFPSGHSWNSLMLFSTMFVILNVYTKNTKRLRGVAKLFLVIAIILPLAIAFSRLYMGEHYPTDVTAGLLGALFFTLLCGSWYMRKFIVREEPARQPVQGWQGGSAQMRAVMPMQSDITQVHPAAMQRKPADGRQRAATPRSADVTAVIEPPAKARPADKATNKSSGNSKGDGGAYVGKHSR